MPGETLKLSCNLNIVTTHWSRQTEKMYYPQGDHTYHKIVMYVGILLHDRFATSLSHNPETTAKHLRSLRSKLVTYKIASCLSNLQAFTCLAVRAVICSARCRCFNHISRRCLTNLRDCILMIAF